jgi:hypothetical protein
MAAKVLMHNFSLSLSLDPAPGCCLYDRASWAGVRGSVGGKEFFLSHPGKSSFSTSLFSLFQQITFARQAK